MEQLSSTNNERIEITILRNFFYNEGFTRKTLPFVKPDYFTKEVLNKIDEHAKRKFSYGTEEE